MSAERRLARRGAAAAGASGHRPLQPRRTGYVDARRCDFGQCSAANVGATHRLRPAPVREPDRRLLGADLSGRLRARRGGPPRRPGGHRVSSSVLRGDLLTTGDGLYGDHAAQPRRPPSSTTWAAGAPPPSSWPWRPRTASPGCATRSTTGGYALANLRGELRVGARPDRPRPSRTSSTACYSNPSGGAYVGPGRVDELHRHPLGRPGAGPGALLQRRPQPPLLSPGSHRPTCHDLRRPCLAQPPRRPRHPGPGGPRPRAGVRLRARGPGHRGEGPDHHLRAAAGARDRPGLGHRLGDGELGPAGALRQRHRRRLPGRPRDRAGDRPRLRRLHHRGEPGRETPGTPRRRRSRRRSPSPWPTPSCSRRRRPSPSTTWAPSPRWRAAGAAVALRQRHAAHLRRRGGSAVVRALAAGDCTVVATAGGLTACLTCPDRRPRWRTRRPAPRPRSPRAPGEARAARSWSGPARSGPAGTPSRAGRSPRVPAGASAAARRASRSP